MRIARACREMGIVSVLAHAEDDDVRFVRRFFDEDVSLGSGRRARHVSGRRQGDRRRAGVAARRRCIPATDFLSERAELAAACEDAGIVFVGPKASSIAAMGSKAEARHLMQSLGVPVVPGYDGEDQSLRDADARGRADRLSAAREGVGGRRREGDEDRPRAGGAAAGDRVRGARGDEGVRRRSSAARALHRRAAARRVPDLRRRPRATSSISSSATARSSAGIRRSSRRRPRRATPTSCVSAWPPPRSRRRAASTIATPARSSSSSRRKGSSTSSR